MEIFWEGMPRAAVLLALVLACCLISPEALSRGPNLCLWRHLLHLPSCPACGSTRALAAFFHGRFIQALAFNRNVLLTGPGLLVLFAKDALLLVKRLRRSLPSSLSLTPRLNRAKKVRVE